MQLFFLKRLATVSACTSTPTALAASSFENMKVLVKLASSSGVGFEGEGTTHNMALDTIAHLLIHNGLYRPSRNFKDSTSYQHDRLSLWFIFVEMTSSLKAGGSSAAAEKLRMLLTRCLCDSLQKENSRRLKEDVLCLKTAYDCVATKTNNTAPEGQRNSILKMVGRSAVEVEAEETFKKLILTNSDNLLKLIQNFDKDNTRGESIKNIRCRWTTNITDEETDDEATSLVLNPIELSLIKYINEEGSSSSLYLSTCLMHLICLQDNPKPMCSFLLEDKKFCSLAGDTLQRVKKFVDGIYDFENHISDCAPLQPEAKGDDYAKVLPNNSCCMHSGYSSSIVGEIG